MAAQFDHLVLGAADLDAGARWVEDMLGVPPQGGGAHAAMGTHNRIWGLKSGYLEVIAIDPQAKAPERPRWFGLDDPQMRARLERGPRLLTWALGVDDLDAALRRCPVDLGAPVSMARGDARWRCAIPADGGLIQDGQAPLLVQWETASPAETMTDQGVSLSRLIARRSETATLAAVLSALEAADLVAVESGAMQPVLMAELETPEGRISFVS